MGGREGRREEEEEGEGRGEEGRGEEGRKGRMGERVRGRRLTGCAVYARLTDSTEQQGAIVPR